MEKLNLAESDLRRMKKFYEDELDQTLEKLEHIKSVLNQLGGSTRKIEIKIEGAKPPAKVRAQATTPGKKRGRKKKTGLRSAWAKLILEQLDKANKPLTYNELTEQVMAAANIPEEKKQSTKNAIVNVTFRLKNRDKMLDTVSAGQKEKYVAKSEWFTEEGKIKDEYAPKVKKAAPRKRKPKTGKRKTTRTVNKKTETAPTEKQD